MVESYGLAWLAHPCYEVGEGMRGRLAVCRLGGLKRGCYFSFGKCPSRGRGDYYETADPFLIQCAVRELSIAVVRKMKIVWGGQFCYYADDLEHLRRSWRRLHALRRFVSEPIFEGRYPEENERFDNVVYTEAVPDDQMPA